MSTESLTKIAPFHDGGDAKVSLEASPSTVCTIHLALTWPRLAAFADPNPPLKNGADTTRSSLRLRSPADRRVLR